MLLILFFGGRGIMVREEAQGKLAKLWRFFFGGVVKKIQKIQKILLLRKPWTLNSIAQKLLSKVVTSTQHVEEHSATALT